MGDAARTLSRRQRGVSLGVEEGLEGIFVRLQERWDSAPRERKKFGTWVWRWGGILDGRAHQHKSFIGWGVGAGGALPSAVSSLVVLFLPFQARVPEGRSEDGKRRETDEAAAR